MKIIEHSILLYLEIIVTALCMRKDGDDRF